MGLLEDAKEIYTTLKDGVSGDGIMKRILDLGDKKATEKAKEVKEKAQEERTGFFGTMAKSFLLRQFPEGGAILDLAKNTGSAIGLLPEEKEVVPWQHEFEVITSTTLLLLRFMPKFLQHFITDIFAKSDIFQKLVANWPLIDGINLPLIGPNGKITEDVKNHDPAAVIKALRIIHQDLFVTGKVGIEKVLDIIKGNIGTTLLTAGGIAMSTGAGDKIMSKGKEILGLPTENEKGKKIIDLAKAHPENTSTNLQKNLQELIKYLGVSENATLEKGDWTNNNDYLCISFTLNQKKYFLNLDNDSLSSDLSINNSEGKEIYKITDWGSFDAEDNSKAILEAIEKEKK